MLRWGFGCRLVESFFHGRDSQNGLRASRMGPLADAALRVLDFATSDIGAALRRRHHLSLFFCLLFDERQTLAWFRDCPRTAEGVRCYLTRRLTPLWTNRWNKAITECPPPRPPTRYFKGGHSSAERILRGEHQLAAEPPHRHRLRCSKRQAGSRSYISRKR
jgi:hypothetical protein